MSRLWLLLVLCVGEAIAQGGPCSPEDMDYDISSCISEKVRIVFSWKSRQCFQKPKDPLMLDCIKCPVNKEVGFNIQNNSLLCQECPENYYNPAGTLKYSSEMKNWWDIGTKIKLRAQYSGNLEPISEYESLVWKPTNDFSFLELNSDFLIPSKENIIKVKIAVFLVEPGSLTFKYKMGSNEGNGALSVFVGNEEELFTNTKKEELRENIIRLNPGQQEIEIKYVFNSEDINFKPFFQQQEE